MMKQYKTLSFRDNSYGREEMDEILSSLSKQGWELKSKEVISQGWSFWKTLILGLIFLPLALLGKKSNIIEIILEKSNR